MFVLGWCERSAKVGGRVAVATPGRDAITEYLHAVLVRSMCCVHRPAAFNATQDAQDVGRRDVSNHLSAQPREMSFSNR